MNPEPDAPAIAPSSERRRLTPQEHRRLARRVWLRRNVTGWCFLLPMFTFFVTFSVLPVLLLFWWSTRKGGLTSGSEYVGFDNFQKLPHRVDAQAAVENTLKFTVMTVPIMLALALGLAMLLSRVKRGGAGYRFLVYFPALVPGVVAGLIWVFLTSVDFGLFNTMLKTFGFQPVTWLNSDNALRVLAALEIWRSTGFWAIFFLAALIGLPGELFQAAELDGANALQRFHRLTLPMMRRVILFAVIVATIGGLQVFDTALVLTSGGPGTSTLTVVYRIWTYTFGTTNKTGYGAAISVALLTVILTLTAIQLWLLRGRRGEA